MALMRFPGGLWGSGTKLKASLPFGSQRDARDPLKGGKGPSRVPQPMGTVDKHMHACNHARAHVHRPCDEEMGVDESLVSDIKNMITEQQEDSATHVFDSFLAIAACIRL